MYGFGHSEEILSEALGSYRNKVVIATKFGVTWNSEGKIGRDCSPGYVIRALEASLKRLRIDCIPLYQIHWPDPNTSIADTMEILKKCQADGKIRHIGCSNFDPALIRKAQDIGRVESLQEPHSLIKGKLEGGALAYCEATEMSVFAYDVLAKGLFSGKFGSASTFAKDDVRSRDENFAGDRFQINLKLVERLREVGNRYGKTPAQVAIRWVLDHPSLTSAITGIKKSEQIEENAGALDWSLSAEDWAFLTGRPT